MRYMRILALLLTVFFTSATVAQEEPPYPRVEYMYNWSDTIVEDQVFVALFNTAVDATTVSENSSCEIQGIGEKVDTRLIKGKQRVEILANFGVDDADDQSFQLLQCKRKLPANAKVKLTIGPNIKNIKTADIIRSSTTPFWREFEVRDHFRVSFSCTRTNSKAPCSPLFPVSLNFSSPVTKKDIKNIALIDGDNKIQADQIRDSDTETNEGSVSYLSFSGPFLEHKSYKLELPADLKDDIGRSLNNADSFPLSFKTDGMPPLIKFTTGNFGIVERFANGVPGTDPDISIPIAMRRVSDSLLTQEMKVSAGKSSDFVVLDAVKAIRWLSRVERMKSGRRTPGELSDIAAVRKIRNRNDSEPAIDVRSRSIFTNKDKVERLDLPGLKSESSATAEMVGLPVQDPGLHIIEIESPELGAALLDDKAGNDKMYVRSAVLVSNLSVHLKLGRDDVLVWVTSLDDGKPVADADIAVLNCDGKPMLSGKTDKYGVWHSEHKVDSYNYCSSTGLYGVYATANIAADHPKAYGKADFALVSSEWNDGIEPWRFDMPYSTDKDPDLVAHAVLDRTLFHAGETVSMKLFVRELNKKGWSNYSVGNLENYVEITHLGSGKEFTVPVTWKENNGGGIYGLAEFTTNKKASLGEYSIDVALIKDDDSYWNSRLNAGDFRVEEFKLPLLKGSIKLLDNSDNDSRVLVAPNKISADVQIDWISGGPASGLETKISAMARPFTPSFSDYSDYRFNTPGDLSEEGGSIRKLILDKQPANLDSKGAARVKLDDLPTVKQPQNWLFESTFKDPNGEVQTISQSKEIWPANIAVGIKSGYWFSKGDKASVKLIVLDTDSAPVANKKVKLEGKVATTYTTRKRLVGGFYSYDSHEQVTSLGTLCNGKTNDDGVLSCSIDVDQNGEVQLFASAKDDAGNLASSAVSVWVWGENSWFGGTNNDRIDVIPDKPSYKPGDTATISVRMPFNQAQALVAIEREGVLTTEVHDLKGDEPVIKLKVKDNWGPNVYVSVLAVRGRIRSVPWSSFFEWGWRHPWRWLDARSDRESNVAAPTAFVDLAKPAYKFGIAELKVSAEADRLKVKVSTNKNTYKVQDTVTAKVQVNLPSGEPAAGASVAFAAVDKALLELYDNNSWNLLQAMRTVRSYGVLTATAQSEVVGRRHYGRKAVPAGGGGGQSVSRELFDTLLLWQGDVTLDDAGQAEIEVPVNDSITSFRLVAVADYGIDKFGTGFTDIASTQDLQLVSGLSQVIREDDNFVARVTLRNRTEKDMSTSVDASYDYPEGHSSSLKEKKVTVPAGKSITISWNLVAPELQHKSQGEITWDFYADSKEASDSLKIKQKLLPKVEIKPFSAALLHMKNNSQHDLPMSIPDRALINSDGVPRGGIDILLQADLAGSLPGVHDWFASYPYTCIEQQSSKYIGMQNHSAWQTLMSDLPSYLKDNGLLSYFPNGAGNINLTAYMVELTALSENLGEGYKLPDYAKEAMLMALQDYVNGKLDDRAWLPSSDDMWRELNVLSALSRAGAIQTGMLDKFMVPVNDWPTPALVSWLTILENQPDVYKHKQYLNQANLALKSRISKHGTTAVLADKSVNQGWWLMSNQATVQAKFLMAVLEDPFWKQDLPLIFNGLLSLQQNGHWQTTSANALGTLAVNAFVAQEQSAVGKGKLNITTSNSDTSKDFEWSAIAKQDEQVHFDWPADGDMKLKLQQDAEGDGWATIISKAAIPYSVEENNGISIKRSIRPISQSKSGVWSVGDIYRVTLTIASAEDLSWTAVSDPLPAGATILGSGLGRDSAIAVENDAEQSDDWFRSPSYVERASDTYRAYYEHMGSGKHTIEYTVRLNTAGEFSMPATRVEALYQPDVFGVYPNDPVVIEDTK